MGVRRLRVRAYRRRWSQMRAVGAHPRARRPPGPQPGRCALRGGQHVAGWVTVLQQSGAATVLALAGGVHGLLRRARRQRNRRLRCDHLAVRAVRRGGCERQQRGPRTRRRCRRRLHVPSASLLERQPRIERLPVDDRLHGRAVRVALPSALSCSVQTVVQCKHAMACALPAFEPPRGDEQVGQQGA